MLKIIRKNAWEQIEELRHLMHLTEQVAQGMQAPNYDVDSDSAARQFMFKAMYYPPSELPAQLKSIYRKIQEMSRVPVARGGFRPSGKQQRKNREWEQGVGQRHHDRLV